jgi:hypothetical protein
MPLILSLFLLGISVAPCADTPATDNMEISFNTEGDDQNHTEDLCSPLCVCHCCHSHLVVHQIALNAFNDQLFPVQKVSYREPVTVGYLGSILQPPQV